MLELAGEEVEVEVRDGKELLGVVGVREEVNGMIHGGISSRGVPAEVSDRG